MLERAKSLANELSHLRREIHQHPELAFQEFQTAALVADTLSEIGGITIQTGVGKTGVIGQIGHGPGPTIAIRADMDALPIYEVSETNYGSQNQGVMHACGHDAHTAILLGVAHLLRHSFGQEKWRGNVRFIFQPAEEAFGPDGRSGSPAMISDGALDGVDAIIALHVFSTLPAGLCTFQDGYSMAAADSFEAWIYGDGGHGAYPHSGSDPLFMLGPILNALYAIPSRKINPMRRCVVSLGIIQGGSADNVIPSEVYLNGTIRSFNPDIREQLWREVENSFKISEVMGGSYRFNLQKGYPPLKNNDQVNHWLRAVARDLVGENNVNDEEFGMGAEDFAYMTQKVPGAMFLLGAALPDGVERHHHTNIFDIDESVLPIGAAILAETARRFVTQM